MDALTDAGAAGEAVMPPAIRCCGVRIDIVSRDEAARRLVAQARAVAPYAVHLCNAHVLALATQDPAYAALLDEGDLNLADGAPLAGLARWLGVPIVGARPSGTELVRAAFALTTDGAVGHFLYGSDARTVALMADELTKSCPGSVVVAAEAPPFRPLSETEFSDLVGAIRAAGRVIVWIGIGTPQQDVLVHALRRELSVPVVPVGAAFDFIAGAKPRAPQWMRASGLEWLHRLITEPRRLWRRYLLESTRFLWHARGAEVATSSPASGAD